MFGPSQTPLPSKSRNHSPVDGRKTPILVLPVPFQSPATGISPGTPKDATQRSFLHLFHLRLPLRSRNHSPVLGRKNPNCVVPRSVQSPPTGTSPLDRKSTR